MGNTHYLRQHHECTIHLKGAIAQGDARKVQETIDTFGFNNSSKRSKWYSFLKLALDKKQFEIARILIRSGAQVNHPKKCSTPLHAAVKHGKLDIVYLLIDNGANVNAENEHSETPLHTALKICGDDIETLDFVVNTDLLDIVDALLDNGANVNAQNKRLETPLHLAVSQNYITQALLDRGACVNTVDKVGRTPLHVAARKGFSGSVLKLIEKGADINSATAVDCPRTHSLVTPLYYAIKYGHADVIKVLALSGAPLNEKMKDGKYPLHIAVQKGNLCIVQALLNLGAEIKQSPDLLNLSIRCARTDTRMVQLLLDEGAEVNPTDSLHPLFVAAFEDNPGVCDILLRRGANVNATLERSKELCLRTAKNDAIFSFADRLGETALHFAALLNHCRVVRVLLKYGADLDSRDRRGNTALHVACSRKNMEMVRLLLAVSDINLVNKNDECIVDSTRYATLKNSRYAVKDDFLEVLSRHMCKLSVADLFVSPQLIESVPYVDQSELAVECKRELVKLKTETVPDCNYLFYDLLRKSLNEIAVISRSENVRALLKTDELLKRFPIYGSRIFVRLIAGKNRGTLLEEIPITYFENHVWFLPYVCVEKIFNYLSNSDLVAFFKACHLL